MMHTSSVIKRVRPRKNCRYCRKNSISICFVSLLFLMNHGIDVVVSQNFHNNKNKEEILTEENKSNPYDGGDNNDNGDNDSSNIRTAKGIALWRLWLLQRLKELDNHKKNLQHVLVKAGLDAVTNHRKVQQRKKEWNYNREWIALMSSFDENDDEDDTDGSWKKKYGRRMAKACFGSSSSTAYPESEKDSSSSSSFFDGSSKNEKFSSKELEIRQKGEVSEITPSHLSTNKIPIYQEPFVGMILQVYDIEKVAALQKQQYATELLYSSYYDGDQNKDEQFLPACIDDSRITGDSSLGGSSSKSTSDHDNMNDDNNKLLLTEYELIHPIHLKLGRTPQHVFDYAYKPVNLLIGGRSSSSYENQDDGDSSSTSPSGADIAATAAVVPEDRNSWFQWLTYLGFVNTNNSNNMSESGSTNYEKMGNHAFAGGSHGEVWRGRRKCPSVSKYQWGVNNNKRRKQQQQQHPDCDDRKPLIMKRLKVEQGFHFLEAGLREVYFGSLLNQEIKSESLFTTYVDHFFREVQRPRIFGEIGQQHTDLELWIVFEDAGLSLRDYLYAPITSNSFVVYQPSHFWTMLRMGFAKTNKKNDTSVAITISSDSNNEPTGPKKDGEEGFNKGGQSQRYGKKGNNNIGDGKALMKEILRQILTSAANLHDHFIVHRDIKPSNIMCKNNVDIAGEFRRESPLGDASNLRCVLGDFSSSWDSFTAQHLYSNGPSAGEQTDEYAPPEALFGSTLFNEEKPHSYDSWSIGVVALELLLGTPNVFTVDQRTTALLTNKMTKKGATAEEIQRALYLAALSQFCIYMPTSTSGGKSWPLRDGDPLHNSPIVKKSCTLKDFHHALRARDPLGLGFDSSADSLLHLIWGLLAWDPLKRLTPSEALRHPYFVGNYDHSVFDLKPGDHNALESLSLDPRMDFNITDTIHEFTCPKCGRKFGDWRSCQMHATSRRHAKFCLYDRSSLPTCLNAHTMLPAHPTSGYCDIQGRRRRMEDFHSVFLGSDHQFYGMFDGHTGNLASKYAASKFYETLKVQLSDLNDRVKNDDNWKDDVNDMMNTVFPDIHDSFLEAVTLSSNHMMDQSGTTATIVYVTDEAVVVASIGDSRAVLSSTQENGNDLAAIQLTIDHVAGNPNERSMVEDKGGYVEASGGIDRVNGSLAITRSIGDANFAPFLSRKPHVIAMTRAEMKRECGEKLADIGLPCFLILASDGLWDVMSNQEAVDMVAQVVENYNSDHESEISWDEGGAFQEAAEILTQDAYMRGSTDNIGVCVIAIE